MSQCQQQGFIYCVQGNCQEFSLCLEQVALSTASIQERHALCY
ncbi:unnamed protein product [Paramecium primaurelia]|uniref:Uncharacterized protein n=1 Tax=Paramecium primaurelia TaxID=5886 RepID=A0A8S1NZ09_PARPR|nr:unnamed protein product [Paramecium primaurelia]